MKASFDRIEEKNKKTEEMKRKKEAMQAEQLEWVPPPMPEGYMKKRQDQGEQKEHREREKDKGERKVRRREPDLSKMNP